MLEHIYGYVPNHEGEITAIFNGINFESLKLDANVTEDYKTAANDKEKGIIRDYSAYADTDGDTLYDFEEIDVTNTLVKWD